MRETKGNMYMHLGVFGLKTFVASKWPWNAELMLST